MKTKLLHKHRKNCIALNAVAMGDWDTPWFLDVRGYDDNQFYADSLCRRRSDKYRGMTRWLVFVCNDPKCKARLAAQAGVIESLVYEIS